jgi:uncharacterized protein YbjQ (UPF0145 family)
MTQTRGQSPTPNLFQISSRRLVKQLTGGKAGSPFFTSDLSTNEFLLAREAGCDPIGLVMGSSFYQVGFYRNFWGYRDRTGEVEALTQAQLAARELAVSRLQQEAALLGADGVIGVRLQQRRKSWDISGMVEFTAIGTAVRIPGRSPTKLPFTSDLSGQEFWQLQQAGYQPKGLVFGVCSYYVHSDLNTRNLMNQSIWSRIFGRGRQNQELVQLTQGFQDARELAITRMTAEIQQLSATGAVGMQIEMSEEIVVYQPQSIAGCLWQLLLLGGIPAIFIAAVSGHAAWVMLIFTFLLAHPIIPWAIGVILFTQSIWNSFANAGPFRDLLTHFVATGTAIVEADLPATNPISNTLMFYPLTKA